MIIARSSTDYLSSKGGDYRIYAVGDIHGRSDCIKRIHENIERESDFEREEVAIIYLGDYIDRGPDSKGVIDELLRLRGKVRQVFLLGNHEHAMNMFMAGLLPYSVWRQWGGESTLTSYGADSVVLKGDENHVRTWLRKNLPYSHLQFMADLKAYHKERGHIFVHAGLRPEIALESQQVEDLVMIRGEFIENPLSVEEVVVYGHTIYEEPNIVDRKIGIDTGAYRTGKLTALAIDRKGYRFMDG